MTAERVYKLDAPKGQVFSSDFRKCAEAVQVRDACA